MGLHLANTSAKHCPAAAVTRRHVWSGALAACVMSPSIAHTRSDYPTGLTVRLVVGFPPGGSQDSVGHILADRLSAHWGASVVVENIAGAGSNIAMNRVARGPADGAQILLVPPGIATNQFLYAKLPFDPEADFMPLALVATFPNLLCVRNSLPVRTVRELIAFAKARPDELNFASTGIGTTPHLAGEMLKRMAGIKFATVHYRGSAPALNDLLAGAVDLMIDNTTSIAPQARSGNVTALGITSLGRWPLAPDYVPVADSVPGFYALAWSGIAVRTGTPAEICARIEAGVKAVCRHPVLRRQMSGLLAEVIGSGPKEFGEFIRAERAMWGKLIADLKIRIGN